MGLNSYIITYKMFNNHKLSHSSYLYSKLWIWRLRCLRVFLHLLLAFILDLRWKSRILSLETLFQYFYIFICKLISLTLELAHFWNEGQLILWRIERRISFSSLNVFGTERSLNLLKASDQVTSIIFRWKFIILIVTLLLKWKSLMRLTFCLHCVFAPSRLTTYFDSIKSREFLT